MKILSIFNTYGGGVQESDKQIQGYQDGLSTLLMQRGVEQDVVLSSCLNTTPARTKLMDVYEDNIFYSFTDELRPLPVTVNLTAKRMTELRGPYDIYCYVDSGIRFREEHQLAHLVHIHYDHKAGMTSALTQNDTGLYESCHWGQYPDDHRDIDKYFKNGIYKFKVGEACCLHLQLFDKSIYDFFDQRIYYECFASQCSEASFSHLCASINKPYIITNEVVVDHEISMDGPSSGFSARKWVEKGNSRFDHPYLCGSLIDIFKRGQHLGLGMQEHCGVVVSPKDQFSSEGFALNPDLKHYIKNNVFLSKELLDYSKIKHQLIQL